jgi:hypothetical protein
MISLRSALALAGLLLMSTGCRRDDPAEQVARDAARAAEQARAHSPEVQATLEETAVRNEAANLEASPVQIEMGNLATLARGAVRNGSRDTVARVVVEFDILGDGGQVLRQDSFNVYNVAPGASAQYQLKLSAGEDSARVRGVRGHQ